MSKEIPVWQKFALAGLAIAGLAAGSIACNETGGEDDYNRALKPTSVDPCQRPNHQCGWEATRGMPGATPQNNRTDVYGW